MKPGVLRRGVVKHHVQNHPDAAGMGVRHQRVELLQRAIGWINGGIVRHVVTVIDLRREIEGRQPDGVHAKLLQIIEASGDARQIACAVAGRILETLRVNLVNHPVLPPRQSVIHNAFLLLLKGSAETLPALP